MLILTTFLQDNKRTAAGNSQFAAMAGKRLRLNVFSKLKVRSSVETYR